jgi:hypothetical protein
MNVGKLWEDTSPGGQDTGPAELPYRPSVSNGDPLPVVYGVARVTPKVIAQLGTKTLGIIQVPDNTTGISGWFEGYFSAVALALCEGPIAGVNMIYWGKTAAGNTLEQLGGALLCSITAMTSTTLTTSGTVWQSMRVGDTIRSANNVAATVTVRPTTGVVTVGSTTGMNTGEGHWLPLVDLATGARSQAYWNAYDDVGVASRMYGYGGTAYVRSRGLALPDGELPDLSFEVRGVGYTGTGTMPNDVNPADVIIDILTNAYYGLGWTTAQIETDLGPDGLAASSFRRYAQAAGFYVSAALVDQATAAERLQAIAEACNSALVWSEGKLKVYPFGDVAITGNGVTYTPPTTPISISEDDFIRDGSAPVKVEGISAGNVFNVHPVSFPYRLGRYEMTPCESMNSAAVDAESTVKRADPWETIWIARPEHAMAISAIRAQRNVYICNRFTFTLGQRYSLLEPMDLLALNDSTLGLVNRAVRITTIEEAPSGGLTITAEDWPIGVATGYVQTPQTRDGIDSGAVSGTYFLGGQLGTQAQLAAMFDDGRITPAEKTSLYLQFADIQRRHTTLFLASVQGKIASGDWTTYTTAMSTFSTQIATYCGFSLSWINDAAYDATVKAWMDVTTVIGNGDGTMGRILRYLFQAVYDAMATAEGKMMTAAAQLAVLASPGGTSTFLRADGTWAAASGGGGGTVTSVTGSGGAVVSASTTVPNVSLTYGTAANTVCQGNDGRLSDSRAASDVSAWAKAGTKPSYTAAEVGALATAATAADSDKLDGQHGAYYAPVASPTFTGNITLPGGKWETGGNVGIGTIAPGAKLQIDSATVGEAAILHFTGSPGGYGAGVTFQANTNNGTAQTMAQIRPTMESGADAAYSGGLTFWTTGGNVSTQRMSIAGNGAITCSSTLSATDVTATSDERLKENVRSIFGALGKVLRLRGVGFQFRDDATHAPRLGLIAQEVQREFPEVVHADADGMLSVSYGSLVGALVEAIKAQQVQIDAIRNRPSLWRRFMRWLRRI